MSAAAVDEGLSFLHALPERPVGVSVPVIVSLASSVFLSYGFFFARSICYVGISPEDPRGTETTRSASISLCSVHVGAMTRLDAVSRLFGRVMRFLVRSLEISSSHPSLRQVPYRNILTTLFVHG